MSYHTWHDVIRIRVSKKLSCDIFISRLDEHFCSFFFYFVDVSLFLYLFRWTRGDVSYTNVAYAICFTETFSYTKNNKPKTIKTWPIAWSLLNFLNFAWHDTMKNCLKIGLLSCHVTTWRDSRDKKCRMHKPARFQPQSFSQRTDCHF